ncbi:MAG: asparagine synthetase B family protein, partial [Flammeovirgaceae bacterium]
KPMSIFEGISKLEPGMIATVSLERPEPQLSTYWNFREVVKECLANPLTDSPEETTTELERLLKQAISMQMEADVPVGAFLSGGVDSSTIVALMQEISRERGGRPVRTFTIGFEDQRYDEAPFAKAVAEHLGTDHTERYVSAADARNVIPKLPSIFSEPFADSSQIPTYLISGVARDSVTVSLSGDAGDELFCGYTRYLVGQELLPKFGKVPSWTRNLMLAILRRFRPGTLAKAYHGLQPLIPRVLRMSNIEDKLRRMETLLDSGDSSQSAIYRLLISQWLNSAKVVRGGSELPGCNGIHPDFASHSGFVEQMMFTDMVAYLPNDILCKVDRAAMAVSLETRVPLLDHTIVEHALRTPLSHKLRNGSGKWPLRQILYKRLPRELIERPKKGFSIPLDAWMRGPLREWTEDLLNEKRLREEGFFDAALIRQSVDMHMSGKANESGPLWCVLMFQAWHASQRDEWSQCKSAGNNYV